MCNGTYIPCCDCLFSHLSPTCGSRVAGRGAVEREGPLNMVARRGYSLAGPSLVSVFGDRMKLVISGGLSRVMTRNE